MLNHSLREINSFRSDIVSLCVGIVQTLIPTSWNSGGIQIKFLSWSGYNQADVPLLAFLTGDFPNACLPLHPTIFFP